VIIAK